jgi:hypothetical protein
MSCQQELTSRNDALDASFTAIELRFVARVSFPRRRESIYGWIPAFAGMTLNGSDASFR